MQILSTECVWREALESGIVAVALVGTTLPPRTEVDEDDCGTDGR